MTVAALAGCAAAQPQAAEPAIANAPVQILVPTSDTEDRVVAEIFRQSLRNAGRSAELVDATALGDVPADRPGDALRTGEANLWLACTGEALEDYNPEEAEELEPKYKAAQEGESDSDEDYLATTHVALIGSLPPELITTDPSSAEGCPNDADVELPENYTPIFNKQLFDRDERNVVSSVAKFLTADDIADITEDADDRGASKGDAKAAAKAVREAVSEWVATEMPAAEINEGGDSDDSSDAEL